MNYHSFVKLRRGLAIGFVGLAVACIGLFAYGYAHSLRTVVPRSICAVTCAQYTATHVELNALAVVAAWTAATSLVAAAVLAVSTIDG